MRRSLLFLLITLPLLTQPALASRCEDLAKLRLPNGVVMIAESVTGGKLIPEGHGPIQGLPPLCRVVAALHPAEDSDIRVELWMPESGWNGRMEGTGNSALAGHIDYYSLINGIHGGYAVVNTDMGMAVPPGKDASVFIDRPERWADWGYRATHEMTVFAKQAVKAYYGRDAMRNYFVGCSTGGEQALMEAQRFPDDYDGIVGGAPALNRTGVHVSILWNFAALRKDPESYVPPAKIALLSTAVLNACDVLDGVKDGLITDPRGCRFDPAKLQCKADDSDNCLTAAQVATVKALYGGPVDPRTGKQLYPGLPLGSETGWLARLAPKPDPKAHAPFVPVFKWALGDKWDWRTFDFDHDVDTLNSRLAKSLNATDPDLDIFRAHGHKLLLYHGWADPLVAPGETVHYYDTVQARDAELNAGTYSGRDAKPLDDSLRLFMVPGMAHCGGGPGPSGFYPLNAVISWVEDGTAPDSLVVSKPQPAPSAPQKRLLCPYPRVAQYKGSGNIDDPASYACGVPYFTNTTPQVAATP